MGMAAWPSALCLLTLLQRATQDMVELSTSPIVYAECGTAVILKCEVSSTKDGLFVKHMGWSLNGDLVCSIDITPVHPKLSLGQYRCLYTPGNLTLILEDVQPQDSGNSTYACKLRSNMGVANKVTKVEFKEPNKCLRSGRKVARTTPQNGVGSVRPMRTLWCISVLLVVILK